MRQVVVMGKTQGKQIGSRTELFELLKKTEREKREHLTALFRKLPEATIKEMVLAEAKKGEYLLRAGMPCDTIFILLEGNVIGEEYQKMGQLYSFMDFAKIVIIGDFEVFTERAEYGASVRADQDCRFLKLSAKSYSRWIRHDENAMFLRIGKILKMFSSEKDVEREWLFMGCKERLVNYLIRLYEREQVNGNHLFRNKKSQAELADKIGYNIRSVQRSIASLNAEGLVSIDRGKIEISQEQYENLKKYTNGKGEATK